MKIKVSHVFPPIPIRTCDYSAIDDSTYDGPGSKIGFGSTSQGAIQDLLDQMEATQCACCELYIVEGEEVRNDCMPGYAYCSEACSIAALTESLHAEDAGHLPA